MDSNSSSEQPSKPSWKEVRNSLANADHFKQWTDVRAWVSRKKAASRIKSLGKEFSVVYEKSKMIQVGDHGICRFRSAPLAIEADNFSQSDAEMFFGNLYVIEEISENQAWIKIATPAGVTGWLEARNHFYISRGEYKILSTFRRSEALNFLVNALSFAR